MHRNRSVDVHQFAMVPRAEIPRSGFRMQKNYKTTFDAGGLVPIYVKEVLPGDTFNVRATLFARMATPLFPVMDNLYLESFWFFVPNRLVWSNWVKFCGEQANPADSISFSIPQIVSAVGGFTVGSIYDYMGLPTVGQVAGGSALSVNALPIRAYILIYNTWFRDENLINSVSLATGDGPDAIGVTTPLGRGKRHDYFTSCLPWTQKGGVAVTLPLGTSAPVKTQSADTVGIMADGMRIAAVNTGVNPAAAVTLGSSAGGSGSAGWSSTAPGGLTPFYPENLYADLSVATAATINSIRQAFQIQRLLERDARGGTRYIEIVRSHFGVQSPDARLQRPEYLGGGSTPVNINPVAQTSATDAGTALGTLSAFGQVAGVHGFSQSFTEHGHIIGIINVRADLTYQQGLHRMWTRATRYDFYWPVFAALGEQAVLNREIYCDGTANDLLVFGYQERWAEYRYDPSQITGLFRSTSAGTIDPWHLAQRFSVLPTLNSTFITDAPPMSRVLAVGAGANGQQFLLDAFIDAKVVRPMPLYSVPGQVDHF